MTWTEQPEVDDRPRLEMTLVAFAVLIALTAAAQRPYMAQALYGLGLPWDPWAWAPCLLVAAAAVRIAVRIWQARPIPGWAIATTVLGGLLLLALAAAAVSEHESQL